METHANQETFYSNKDNKGFLIMAAVVLYRLAKEKDEAKLNSNTARYEVIFLTEYRCHQHYRYWIKVVIKLVVVMGIAWIGNVLFFDGSLIFVAYIMTIFIAGQGIIIFILFVPLSKQV